MIRVYSNGDEHATAFDDDGGILVANEFDHWVTSPIFMGLVKRHNRALGFVNEYRRTSDES